MSRWTPEQLAGFRIRRTNERPTEAPSGPPFAPSAPETPRTLAYRQPRLPGTALRVRLKGRRDVLLELLFGTPEMAAQAKAEAEAGRGICAPIHVESPYSPAVHDFIIL